jgi:hypothetical protein
MGKYSRQQIDLRGYRLEVRDQRSEVRGKADL